MDILWSPWRYAYINKADKTEDATLEDCVFCRILKTQASDEVNFILHRAAHNFIILNAYPYISGHLMIVPYAHAGSLDSADKAATDEMMDLTKKCQTILREVYRPDGMNLGMNQGKAAGAGVAEHFHMHILPRWVGDSNFMTPISETRTMPESLQITFEKLKGKF